MPGDKPHAGGFHPHHRSFLPEASKDRIGIAIELGRIDEPDGLTFHGNRHELRE